MYTMSTRILRARRLAKLSQAVLAAKIGVHRSAVAQWEQADGTSPNTQHLEEVATLVGVHFEWLATGRGPMRPADDEFEPTIDILDFAQTELESRILECTRRLSPKHQKIACSILELLAG